MTGDLSIRVVTDNQEFQSLRETWDSLLAKSQDNDVYLTWEWFFTWWQHYGQGKRLNILVIEDGKRIIGIVPLMRAGYGWSPFHVDVWENISAMDTDYSGVVLAEREEECVAAFLAYLQENLNGAILRLSRIPEKSAFFDLMRRQYPPFSPGLSLEQQTLAASPCLPLPANWDEYLSSFSSKTRNTLRRKLRLLSRDHSVEFQCYCPDDNLQENVRAFIELHERGWQARDLKGALFDARMKDFQQDIADVFSAKGWFNLSFLTVDGKPASAVYGFEYRDKFYYGLSGFDPDYSQYSPGQLHIMFLIESAIKKGLKEFDFLIGDEEYKYRWHALDQGNLQIIIVRRHFLNQFRLKLLDAVTLYDKVSQYGLAESLRRYLRRRKRRQDNQHEI